MTGRLSLVLALVVLAGCGRTEPVGPRGHPASQVITPAADAGFTVHLDAGLIIAGQCEGPSLDCPRGFHCESGTCVLNGDNSELQVTLQWHNTPRTPDDLDLHLIEPLPVQGTCEIYYGSGGLFSCGAVGVLDLDANGACIDTDPSGGPASDTENIIYPPGRAAPEGHYIVRVDYWSECSGSARVPFVLTVRKGSVVTERRGVFHAGEADSGEAGSGVTVLEFDVP